MKLTDYSVYRLSELLCLGEVSCAELTDAYLEQIEKTEENTNAYITLCADDARKGAADCDRRRAAGEPLSPLAGIPMGVADNICTMGVKTTCGSKFLEGFTPPYDAAVMERLSDAVMLGKLNLDEFAIPSSGRGSNGAAAAVAAAEAAFTIGTDAGGSLLVPASLCGMVGMRPTYGTVSRFGIVAVAPSLEQIGAITKNVRDSALVIGALSGHDRRDSTSLKTAPADFTAKLEGGVRGIKIALPSQYFDENADTAVKSAVLAAAKQLEAQGAQLVEVSMPTLDYALPAHYIISSAQASSSLARFDGVTFGRRAAEYEDINDLYCRSRGEGFGIEAKRRIIFGTFALSAGCYEIYYNKALRVRTLIKEEFNSVFEKCDIILTPAAPYSEKKAAGDAQGPLAACSGELYTAPAALAGLPAITLPCAADRAGLPVGVQLIGRAFGEVELFGAAAAIERAVGDSYSIMVKAGDKA